MNSARAHGLGDTLTRRDGPDQLELACSARSIVRKRVLATAFGTRCGGTVHIHVVLLLMLCGASLNGCFPIHGLARYGVAGNIVDGTTGIPVPDAVVTVGRQQPVSVHTAVDGSFLVPTHREWFVFLLVPVPQDPPLDVVRPTLTVVRPGYESRVLDLRDFPLEDGVVGVGTLNLTSTDR